MGLDIAMKSSTHHPKYKKKMRALLKVHVQHNAIANAIIGYVQNPYRWFQIRYAIDIGEGYDDGDYYFNEHNPGVIFLVEYDDDDYFRGNGFYKPKTIEPPTSVYGSHGAEWCGFDELRSILPSKYVNCMSDADLAKFVISIDSSQLRGGLWSHYDV